VGEFQERLEGKHHAQLNAIPSDQELNRRVPYGTCQSENTVWDGVAAFLGLRAFLKRAVAQANKPQHRLLQRREPTPA
jgi:hypothetical protein